MGAFHVGPLWDFWFWNWEHDPDNYYAWQCNLLSERAPV